MVDTNQKKTEHGKPYIVRDEELLYKLSDAGLLCHAFRIASNRDDVSKRVWFFERNPDVWDIIKQYNTAHKQEPKRESSSEGG